MSENALGNMRPSRVLNIIRGGGVAACLKMNLSCPHAVEIAARSGFDCIWLDMEHVAGDWSGLKSQIYAAKSYDTDIVMRVPRGSYSDLIKPLEMDASGIMVPHVMSAGDARQVVRHTRFHPLGLRPADGGNSDGGYGMMDFNEYIRSANENRFVIAQIEDPEPLDELDEICALEGIDVILYGAGDFSQAIGAPAQWDHPEIARVRKLIAETARKHGKGAGAVCPVDKVNEYTEMGYNFLSIGADVIGFANYCMEIMGKFKNTSFGKANGAYS